MSTKKRKSKYPPYDAAKQQALDLQLNSRQAYIDWHTENNIKYLPRYPERTYKEFTSWNDWLGTANVFRGKPIRPWRSWWEAVKWSQEYAAANDINTMAEWLAHVKDVQPPDDIPTRPDTSYPEFYTHGWKTWLGTDIRGRLAAAKADTALMCICSFHTLSKPGNVYAVLHAEKGEAELRQMLTRRPDLRVVRAYKVENDLKETVLELINAHGRYDGEGWFIPQVNNLVFELDNVLIPFVG